MSQEQAKERVQSLVDRWNNTPAWHQPEFLEGTINITTGDLLAIKIMFENADHARAEGFKNAIKVGVMMEMESLPSCRNY